MVMTFSAAGWNLRIFFFSARDARTRHRWGTGGRDGLASPGLRIPCPGRVLSRPVPLRALPSVVSLPLDSASPKQLAEWALASSSLLSATVELGSVAHWAGCSGGWDTPCALPGASLSWTPAALRPEISAVDLHLRGFFRDSKGYSPWAGAG